MINRLSREIHQNNVDKGFYIEPTTIAERIALIHSEVSEALEADRKGRRAALDKFIGFFNHTSLKDKAHLEQAKTSFEEHIKDTFEDELADIMIRVMDLAQYEGIDLERHIAAKVRYNTLRPYKHGKKY